ncbi:MAG: response regulator [Candidatus Hydrogenedentes bacterium]|nr:response regulator [Candidatus Hydrogenedentota bacterium]
MAKILVADDDMASLDVMALALSAEGHQVLCATNGQEAYELTLSDQPDLVLLDIMMPIYSGYEVCELLRNDTSVPPELPVVFLTSMDADKRMMEKVGATDHLPKRHMVVELRDLIIKHLGEKANPQNTEG